MRSSLKQILAGVLFSSAVGITPSAHALLYNLDYSAWFTTVSFDLVLNVNTVDGACSLGCPITSVTGSSPQYGTVTTLLSPGSFLSNDNLFYIIPGSPYLKYYGFAFALSSGAKANIFFDQGAYQATWQPLGGALEGRPGTVYVSLVPVPEPETYAMLLTGLGLLGLLARRRKLK